MFFHLKINMWGRHYYQTNTKQIGDSRVRKQTNNRLCPGPKYSLQISPRTNFNNQLQICLLKLNIFLPRYKKPHLSVVHFIISISHIQNCTIVHSYPQRSVICISITGRINPFCQGGPNRMCASVTRRYVCRHTTLSPRLVVFVVRVLNTL